MENSGSGSGDNDANHLSNMRLNDHKAGMQGLDVDKINDIIEKASKGSKFYEHKKKSQERVDKKVAEMKAAMAKVTPEQRKGALAKVCEGF